MKKVEITMTFTVPGFYTFDEVSGVVSQIIGEVRESAKKRNGAVGVNADVVSVVVDEDDEEDDDEIFANQSRSVQ